MENWSKVRLDYWTIWFQRWVLHFDLSLCMCFQKHSLYQQSFFINKCKNFPSGERKTNIKFSIHQSKHNPIPQLHGEGNWNVPFMYHGEFIMPTISVAKPVSFSPHKGITRLGWQPWITECVYLMNNSFVVSKPSKFCDLRFFLTKYQLSNFLCLIFDKKINFLLVNQQKCSQLILNLRSWKKVNKWAFHPVFVFCFGLRS